MNISRHSDGRLNSLVCAPILLWVRLFWNEAEQRGNNDLVR